MNRSELSPLTVLEVKPKVSGSRIGNVVGMTKVPLVDFEGNALGPQPARVTSSVTPQVLMKAFDANLPVLLVFEGDDATRPVIVDVVADFALDAGRDDEYIPSAGQKMSDSKPPLDAGTSYTAGHGDIGVSLARIVGVSDGVVILEDTRAATGNVVRAGTTVPLRNLKDPVVVLRFADGSSVIVGQLCPSVPIEMAGAQGADVLLKGARVTIEADVELTLKSGASVVKLDRRGTVLTTGDQIVSRARGRNRVQGGSVHLN